MSTGSASGDSDMDLGGDSQRNSAQRRGRGPTQITRVINTQGKQLKFDRFHRPVVTNTTTTFPTQMGVVVKRTVPINIFSWSEVDDSLKAKIWETLAVNFILSLYFTIFQFISPLTQNFIYIGFTDRLEYT
jgi:hypothetical protein